MITARLRVARDGTWRAATLSGHAGRGCDGAWVKGSNPACAAVSLLVDATLFTLSGVYGIEPAGLRDDGVQTLALPALMAEPQRAAAQALMENLRVGLLLLAERQPEHITVTIEEE